MNAKAVIREREREICAAEKLLLVKILFEEVRFKASFEGGKERAVTESERKRIPDLDSREAKGTTTMLFSFEEGDVKDSIVRRRVQRPRRDIDLDKFSQVLRGSASDDLTAGASYFVFNSLFYGEPVQLLEKRFGVFCSTRFKDEFSCRVLYLLKWFDDCLWITCQ